MKHRLRFLVVIGMYLGMQILGFVHAPEAHADSATTVTGGAYPIQPFSCTPTETIDQYLNGSGLQSTIEVKQTDQSTLSNFVYSVIDQSQGYDYSDLFLKATGYDSAGNDIFNKECLLVYNVYLQDQQTLVPLLNNSEYEKDCFAFDVNYDNSPPEFRDECRYLGLSVETLPQLLPNPAFPEPWASYNLLQTQNFYAEPWNSNPPHYSDYGLGGKPPTVDDKKSLLKAFDKYNLDSNNPLGMFVYPANQYTGEPWISSYDPNDPSTAQANLFDYAAVNLHATDYSPGLFTMYFHGGYSTFFTSPLKLPILSDGQPNVICDAIQVNGTAKEGSPVNISLTSEYKSMDSNTTGLATSISNIPLAFRWGSTGSTSDDNTFYNTTFGPLSLNAGPNNFSVTQAETNTQMSPGVWQSSGTQSSVVYPKPNANGTANLVMHVNYTGDTPSGDNQNDNTCTKTINIQGTYDASVALQKQPTYPANQSFDITFSVTNNMPFDISFPCSSNCYDSTHTKMMFMVYDTKGTASTADDVLVQSKEYTGITQTKGTTSQYTFNVATLDPSKSYRFFVEIPWYNNEVSYWNNFDSDSNSSSTICPPEGCPSGTPPVTPTPTPNPSCSGVCVSKEPPSDVTCRWIPGFNNITVTDQKVAKMCVGSYPNHPSTTVEGGQKTYFYVKYRFFPLPLPDYTVTTNLDNPRTDPNKKSGVNQTYALSEPQNELGNLNTFSYWPVNATDFGSAPALPAPYIAGPHSFSHYLYRGRFFPSGADLNFTIQDPTGVVTDSTVSRTPTLSGAISATDTSLSLSPGVTPIYPSPPFKIRVGSEIMIVNNVNGLVLSGLQRGQNGTVATSHNAGNLVQRVTIQGSSTVLAVGTFHVDVDLNNCIDATTLDIKDTCREVTVFLPNKPSDPDATPNPLQNVPNPSDRAAWLNPGTYTFTLDVVEGPQVYYYQHDNGDEYQGKPGVATFDNQTPPVKTPSISGGIYTPQENYLNDCYNEQNNYDQNAYDNPIVSGSSAPPNTTSNGTYYCYHNTNKDFH